MWKNIKKMIITFLGSFLLVSAIAFVWLAFNDQISKELLVKLRDSVAIVGLPILIWRIVIMQIAYQDDHEKSRRECAIDLLKFWTYTLNERTSAARKLVEKFDQGQCEKLNNQQSFDIDLKIIKEQLLRKALTPSGANVKYDRNNNIATITEAGAIEMRWTVITYLNALETICAAYHNYIADRDIIKSQFAYLVNEEGSDAGLSTFREAGNLNESYPGLNTFIKRLEEEKHKKKEKKMKKEKRNLPRGKSKLG